MTEPASGIHVVPETDTDPRDKVGLLGRDFHLADQIGLMPLLRFAHAAQSGLDSADIEGMAAMYDLLRQCVADDEWAEFEAHATTRRADDDHLLDFIQQVISVLAERPTRRRSASSGGPPPTSPRSGDGSSSRAIARLEERGRPDLALIVSKAAQARAG